MRSLFKNKSKVLIATAVLSALLFILCIPVILQYSKFVAYTNISLTGNYTTHLVYCVLGGQMVLQFSFIVILLIMIASLFNVAGFLYNKHEFNFVAIGLFLIVTCMGCYVFSSCGTTLLLLLFIISIMGYIDQYGINLIKEEKSKKNNK